MKKFTLIELLAVVAIICILASLLLPSLKEAKEASKTAVCVSNIAQVNKALQAYIIENSGAMPFQTGALQRDVWPSFVDPYISGGEFQGANDQTKESMSKIWTACPNTERDERTRFRDADYAAVFPFSNSYNPWPRKIMTAIDQPSSSGILTEGNNEQANPDLGNSWIQVGTGAQDSEYNTITGLSTGTVRHMSGKSFGVSTFDGAAKSIRWMNLASFSREFGKWVDNY